MKRPASLVATAVALAFVLALSLASPAAFAHFMGGAPASHFHLEDVLGIASVVGLMVLAAWIDRRSK